MNETCQNITSELICSEPVSCTRSLETDGCVLLDNNGIVIEQEICKDGDQYEENDDSKTDHCHSILFQAAPDLFELTALLYSRAGCRFLIL